VDMWGGGGVESNHSPPSSAPYVFMVWYLVENRNNFTFLPYQLNVNPTLHKAQN
jgi:hypothetical protein